MKVGILSRDSKLYSTRRILEVGKDRGHEVEVYDTLKCYMNISSIKPTVQYGEKTLDDLDAVIPRIGASITFYGTAVVRQFETMGCYVLNESIAISRSRDKLRSLQIFARRGIDLPITGFAHSTKQTQALIDLVGSTPLVIKLLEGTQGKGVVLAETHKAAESVIDAFREMDAHFLVQEYIKEAGGSDIRCFIIGDKVVASMQRTAKEGEFRSNLHRGAKAREIKITPEERKIALQAAKAMGLNIAGVDLLRSSRGPLVMEVNSSPGLEGIERATGVDIAKLMFEFIEKKFHGWRDQMKSNS